MALTKQQEQARDGKITASRVGILMSGDDAKILNLWREIVGDPAFVPEDLSSNWAVQLGSCTEQLHLDWYEKQTGHKLSHRGKVCVHPVRSWAAATLDGFDAEIKCPVETKHVNAFSKMPDVVARYMPQLHWQMLCADVAEAVLSVIIGAQEPQQQLIKLDSDYALELWTRAERFWHCVETLTPPVTLPPVAAPIPQAELIEVDMTGNNAWANFSGDWLAYKDGAKKFDTAAKELKALVESNVGFAYGHGIEIKRSKSNSLTIREAKP